MMSVVSSTESVVCVMYASFSVRGSGSRATSSSVCTSTISSGASPIVPTTSSWPACPIRKIVKPAPAKRLASLCTLVTSGQVASIARNRRSAALRCTSGATPCAESTTVAPSGTSSSLSTKIAPCCSSRRTTWMLCTICLRT